jgi:hypothetical protein
MKKVVCKVNDQNYITKGREYKVADTEGTKYVLLEDDEGDPGQKYEVYMFDTLKVNIDFHLTYEGFILEFDSHSEYTEFNSIVELRADIVGYRDILTHWVVYLSRKGEIL